MSNEELKRQQDDAGAAEPETEKAAEGETVGEKKAADEKKTADEEISADKEVSGDKKESDSQEDGAEKPAAAEEDPLNTKYLRLMADFQNYKRRTEKEKSDIYAFANEKIVSELLNVIDNFERALDAGNEGDSFVEGMNLIFKQLQGVLEKAGVVEIEALGREFDPNFHHAVMTEDSEEYESGKITAVLQKGYLLNNKVIRPSMVKVAN